MRREQRTRPGDSVQTFRMTAIGQYVRDDKGGAMKSRDSKDATDLVVSHALRADGFDASEDGTGRGTPLVPVLASTLKNNHGGGGFGSDPSETFVPMAFDTTQVTSKANYSNPKPGDPCHPLASGAHAPAIAFSCKDHGADAGDTAPTLRSMGHDGSHANAGGQVAVAFNWQGGGHQGDLDANSERTSALQAQQVPAVVLPILEPGSRTGKSTDDKRCSDGIGKDGDPMFTLQGSRTHGVATEPYTLAIRGRGNESSFEPRQDGTANALMTPNGGRAGIGVGAVATTMAVRRLTPRECERLQGVPDDFTAIPGAADGPRYKALGNGMARPVVGWILRRLLEIA